jgi:prephenate dehydrogenase
MRSAECARIGIVGLGHIGGSLAGRLVARGRSVLGYDPDPRALRAIAARFGVETCSSLEELARRAELLVVACPTPMVPSVLSEVSGVGFEGTVLETASVKGEILAARQRLASLRLVSVHAMAGRELGGAASADPAIFDGARWAIVLTGEEPEEAVVQAARLVTDGVGDELLGLDAAAHDQIMALVTALPHATAILLARALERLPYAQVAAVLAAGSLRDGVRVARTPADRLVELLLPNARDLARQLEELLADGAALLDMLNSREGLLAFVAPATNGAERVIMRGADGRRVVVVEGGLGRLLVAVGREGWCLRELVREGADLVAVLAGGAALR